MAPVRCRARGVWDGISLTATGPADATLMVLVDCPDRDDGEAGQILSGAPGRLFDRMLAAIGQSRETVHLASVCARGGLSPAAPRPIWKAGWPRLPAIMSG